MALGSSIQDKMPWDSEEGRISWQEHMLELGDMLHVRKKKKSKEREGENEDKETRREERREGWRLEVLQCPSKTHSPNTH